MGQKHDKKLWTRQEDQCLKRAIQAIGDDKWNEVALKFNAIFFETHSFKSHRFGKQCRERWYNKLNPALQNNEEKWTQQHHDAMINAYKQYGSRWSKLIQLLYQTFSIQRSDNGIKNHFHTLVKKGMKQLNQFVDQYNDQCKQKGLFEQKQKKKYFYPRQLSLEKQLRIRKKNLQLLPQNPSPVVEQMSDYKVVQVQIRANNDPNKMEVEKQVDFPYNNVYLDEKSQAHKQNFIVKQQDQGTKQKLDYITQNLSNNIDKDRQNNTQNHNNFNVQYNLNTQSLNTGPIKYLTPLKAVDKKIIDRLVFMVHDKNPLETQQGYLLPDQQSFFPLRNTFLQYMKNSQTFTHEQSKELAEEISNYTQHIRKFGKRSICVKKKKKPLSDYSYLDIHRASRKLFEKIKERFPQHNKAFSVSRHQILARTNVLVSKIRQRQLELQEQVKKKYFLRKDEEEVIIGNIVREALMMHKNKKDEETRKKKAVWQRKRILTLEQLKKQKSDFIAKGGTAEQFQSIQEENKRLKLENQRLKARLVNQQKVQSISIIPIIPIRSRRIKRLQIPKVKPIRKNKLNQDEQHPNPPLNLNQQQQFTLGEQYQKFDQFLQKGNLLSILKEKFNLNTYPSLFNGISELPIQAFIFFEDYSQSRLKQTPTNPTFLENIITIPMKMQQQKNEQNQFEQKQKNQVKPVKKENFYDETVILKAQDHTLEKAQPVSRNQIKSQQMENQPKKYPSSQLIFKIPHKRPLQQKHIESQHSSYSLKSKKSIRPKLLLNCQQRSGQELPSPSNLRKQNSIKNIDKFKERGFEPFKNNFPDFLARSIELAPQQNQLNRSWKFNIQQDPVSPINSNRSNFFAFNTEPNNPFNHSQAVNLQFLKQLNNSQEIMGPNSIFNKGSSTNYNTVNKPQSIYKSCDFMEMSYQNFGQPIPVQNNLNAQNNQESNLEMNSFLQNIRKIQETEGNNWKEPKVYHFTDPIPQNMHKESVQTPVSNTNKGFSAFNLFNSQPLDFEIPHKLIETANNTNFPIRNYNDYSLNYQHVNSLEFSKVFEFDKKFGFNSARLSEIEILKQESRIEENRSRSKEFDAGSNMFKSQRIQSLHGSCGFLNKSRQLSNSCIYSSHEQKHILGGKTPENSKKSIQWNKSQKMFGSQMEDQEKRKK